MANWYDGLLVAVTNAGWSVTATHSRDGSTLGTFKGTKDTSPIDIFDIATVKITFAAATSDTTNVVVNDMLTIDSKDYYVQRIYTADDGISEFHLEVV